MIVRYSLIVLSATNTVKYFQLAFFFNTFPLTVIYTITPCLKKRATFGLLTYNFDTHEWILIFFWQ